MLLMHATLFADSRARLRDGSRIEINSAMIPITTSNSTSVNPRATRHDREDLRRIGIQAPEVVILLARNETAACQVYSERLRSGKKLSRDLSPIALTAHPASDTPPAPLLAPAPSPR